MDALSLKQGARIEVLWEVTQSGRKSNVWWAAEVFELENGREGVDARPRASIKYDAMLGHESTESSVVFLPNQRLQCATETSSKPHIWRLIDQSSTEQPASDDRSSTSRHVSRREAPMHVQVPSDRIHDGPGLDTIARLDSLEKVVAGIQAVTSMHIRYQLNWEAAAARPLHFARHKLGIALDKIIPRPQTCTGPGALTTKQEFLRMQVDCTLEEFENVCRVARESSENGVYFVPSFGATQSQCVNGNSLFVYFTTLSSLCKCLGIRNTDDVARTVWKDRAERASGMPSVIRIVGVMAPENNAEGPMSIAIGRSFLCKAGTDETIHVLHRDSRRWDPVEREYPSPLEIKEVQISSGRESLETFDTGIPSEGCFAFRWMMTSKFEARSSLSPANKKECYGTLETYVPVVYFRGEVVCAEVSRICSAALISEILSE